MYEFRRSGIECGVYLGSSKATSIVLANDLSQNFPGVVLIEKRVDEDTDADVETVIAQSGAVPDNIMNSTNWSMPLH